MVEQGLYGVDAAVIKHRQLYVCFAADAGLADAKRRRVDMTLTSTANAQRSTSVTAGNDSSSSDNDDERSSPASSTYFVTSGAEEDLTTLSGTRRQRQKHVCEDEGRRDAALHVERQDVDVVIVASHQDESSERHHRATSILAPAASCTGSGSRTIMAGKSGGGAEKSCRPGTTTSKVGAAAAGHSRTDVELLYRLFPHVPPVTLDCVLLSCAGNVVQCIDQLLKFHQLKPGTGVDMPPSLPVGGANLATAAAAAVAAAAYAGLPPHAAVPMYHQHHHQHQQQQRFVPSSSIEPLVFPLPPAAGGKPATALPLMSAYNGPAAADTQINTAPPPRALPPFSFTCPPAAALLPTIAGLRYNYSAMMAAAAMAHASSTTPGASAAAVPKTTLSGLTSLSYGLFTGGAYKCTGSSSAESDK